MARKPRFEYPGGIYHLIQRGNNREYIFQGCQGKEFLLKLITENSAPLDYEIYGYAIMDNHYHLIIKTGKVSLGKIMHLVNNTYSRNYNKINKRTGHVFDSRYKSILVADDRYLLSLLRYIHRNPVLPKICDRIEDYPWSSDKYYRNNIKEYINIDFILTMFSIDRTRAISSYIKFMDENVKDEGAIFEEVEVIGLHNIAKIDQYFGTNRKSMDEILKEVTADEKIYAQIKLGSRKRVLTQFKRKYIEECIKEKYTLKEIGKSILISDSGVYKLLDNSI